jgi:hypothetical protein
MPALTTTRLASYFDDQPAAASYSIARTLSSSPPTGVVFDHTAPLGVKAVPKPPESIMGKTTGELGFGEAHQLLKYESSEAAKLHEKMRGMYMEYGKDIPGFREFERVQSIKNAVREKIKEAFSEYASAHPRENPSSKKATRQATKKFFKGRLLHMREKIIRFPGNLEDLNSKIEALYKNHITHKAEETENVCPTKHEHGYHLFVMQKWCNTAVYSLMKVAEHAVKHKESKGAHDEAMLAIADKARVHTDKCHAIRQRLKEIRAANPPRRKRTIRRPAAPDTEDLRKLREGHHHAPGHRERD